MNEAKLLHAGGIKWRVVLIFSLSLFSYKLEAQVLVTGKVTDIASKAPLYPATVLDKTSGRAVYADSLGDYRIIVNGGDELQYSYLGFYTKKYTVPERLTDVIHNVQLISKREKLSEVEIRAMTSYQRDSLDRINAFKYYLDKPPPHVVNPTAHSLYDKPDPNYNDAFGIELNPFSLFSKKGKEKRRFYKMYPRFEREAFINSRYTPELVTRLTGLKGDSLALFLYHYRPSYEFTRRSTDLEFWSWIKIQYRSWIKPK